MKNDQLILKNFFKFIDHLLPLGCITPTSRDSYFARNEDKKETNEIEEKEERKKNYFFFLKKSFNFLPRRHTHSESNLDMKGTRWAERSAATPWKEPRGSAPW